MKAVQVTGYHLLMGLCSVLAVATEVIQNYVGTGNPLPFHLAAGTALAVGGYVGAVSRSILKDSGKPASTIEADVLRVITESLANGDKPTLVHMAVLDVIKQNILNPPKAA
jgi:hypothetical protein